jgi:hypothetical protein
VSDTNITISWSCDHCGREADPTRLNRPDLDSKSALLAIPSHPEWLPDGWLIVPIEKSTAFGTACSQECLPLVQYKLAKDPGFLYRDGLRRFLERAGRTAKEIGELERKLTEPK